MRLLASAATCSNGTNGLHSTTAWPRSSSPRRPARPVSWVYSPGVRNVWWSPVNLLSFSMTTVLAGMLMPTASVSVANTTFTRPSTKQASTDLLERRHHAGVVGGDAGLELREELAVAEHREVGRVDAAEAGIDDLADAVALGAAW